MTDWQALPVAPSSLGESPFWHPDEAALYWCDIPGRALHRWHPATAAHRTWSFDTEPGSCAPFPGGTLLIAMRDGLFRFDPQTGKRTALAEPPYDPRSERFNDGKADPQGRFWVATLSDARTPTAALYRWGFGRLKRMAGDITVGNGLAFSPDGRTLYCSDTAAHIVFGFDLDPSDGSLSGRRDFARFGAKPTGGASGGGPVEDGHSGDGHADGPLPDYRGRPDGAAVDSTGAYWCAMYEGQRLLRFASDGRLLQELPLPVRCPTMPCFGGPDLRTLYVTTARDKRPAAELEAQPLAGCVLSTRVDVPGLPVNFARG